MFKKAKKVLSSNLGVGVVLWLVCFMVRSIGLNIGVGTFLFTCVITTIYVDLYIHTEQYGIRLFAFNILQCMVFVLTASVTGLGLVKGILVVLLGSIMFISKKILFYGEELQAMTYLDIVLTLAGVIFFIQQYRIKKQDDLNVIH